MHVLFWWVPFSPGCIPRSASAMLKGSHVYSLRIFTESLLPEEIISHYFLLPVCENSSSFTAVIVRFPALSQSEKTSSPINQRDYLLLNQGKSRLSTNITGYPLCRSEGNRAEHFGLVRTLLKMQRHLKIYFSRHIFFHGIKICKAAKHKE